MYRKLSKMRVCIPEYVFRTYMRLVRELENVLAGLRLDSDQTGIIAPVLYCVN
jgi:hypothetical protein